MYSLSIVLGSSIALFLIGSGLGFWLGQRTSTQGQKGREIERKLDRVLQEKKAYEDDVSEHFNETAALLNTLTDNYRDIHNHLATGASELCQDEGPVMVEQLTNSSTDPREIPAQLADIQAPLDYAPKSSPHEKGMLNESFGLDKEQTQQADKA